MEVVRWWWVPDVSTRVGPDQIFLSPLDNGWDHGSPGAVTGWADGRGGPEASAQLGPETGNVDVR